MVDENAGEEYLEIFDSLDASKAENRRIAVYCLAEYYKTVMTEVGRDRVRADIGVHQLNLTTQWGQLLAWIAHDPEDERVERFHSAIRMLKEMRNEVAHNQLEQVEQDRLEELRGIADDWKQWLLSQANPPNTAYSTKEVIIAKVRQNLDITETAIEELRDMDLTEEERYEVEDWEIPYELCIRRFEQLEKDESNEITPDLVEWLMMSYDVRISFLDLQNQMAARRDR